MPKKPPKKRLPPGDDGHTILSMQALDPLAQATPDRASTELDKGPESMPPSPKEMRWILFASLRAAFLLAAVFSLAIVALVAFLLLIWR